jgi:hypothetical protein
LRPAQLAVALFAAMILASTGPLACSSDADDEKLHAQRSDSPQWQTRDLAIEASIPSADPLAAKDSDNGFFQNWFARVAATQAEQPRWITPVVTVTPRLEQEFRYDLSRQVQPNATTTLQNYGGSKGLELIPSRHVELILSPPPYLVRSVNGVPDGYGDVSFLLKYRFFSANERHGNYILTAFLGASLPTGSYTNGARDAAITPTLAAGKGWGNFDVTSTFGAVLPLDQALKIGRQLVWNTAVQYRVFRKIWPEVELNSSFFSNGPNDGKKQTFLTPGFVLGKFPIWHRLGFTIGTAGQIATTRFHQYNHRYILTVRFPF